MNMYPKFLDGANYVDDRGSLKFFNNLDLSFWKRFYLVENHRQGFIRAWHGHKNEHKLIIPISGVTLVGAVHIDDWSEPSKNLEINKFILSSHDPKPLLIPNGYANGFKNLTSDSSLLIFSSSSLSESHNDDYRFDWNYWNCWEENFR